MNWSYTFQNMSHPTVQGNKLLNFNKCEQIHLF